MARKRLTDFSILERQALRLWLLEHGEIGAANKILLAIEQALVEKEKEEQENVNHTKTI